MRKLLSLLVLIVFTFGCSQQTPPASTKEKAETSVASTGNFGNAINNEGALQATELTDLLIEKDSVPAKLKGIITTSCTHTGCWMDVDMGGGQSVHVVFKDDGFTIPLDAAGKKTVFSGLAYKELIPVETLKNYARDDGKSEDEINTITEPEWAYNFIADGVIISE